MNQEFDGEDLCSLPRTMFERFRRSTEIAADNWRDPQYDWEAIQLASSAERQSIESLLVSRGVRHALDVQALTLLETPSSRETLIRAFREGPPEVRAAVARYIPDLIDVDERLAELLQRIAECDVYRGLSFTLEQIETCHPPLVVQAMLHRIQRDPGAVAVHFAALLLYLHGASAEPFDWEQRPFVLRFNPGNESDRTLAFAELCQRIGVTFA